MLSVIMHYISDLSANKFIVHFVSMVSNASDITDMLLDDFRLS